MPSVLRRPVRVDIYGHIGVAFQPGQTVVVVGDVLRGHTEAEYGVSQVAALAAIMPSLRGLASLACFLPNSLMRLWEVSPWAAMPQMPLRLWAEVRCPTNGGSSI